MVDHVCRLPIVTIFHVRGILLRRASLWCGFYTFSSGEIRWVPVLRLEIGNNPLILGIRRARNVHSQRRICLIRLLKAALNGTHLGINGVDNYGTKIFALMSKKCYVTYRVDQNKRASRKSNSKYIRYNII